MMNFRSDNEAGAHPLVIDALGHALASGSPASFGEDEWTRRVEQRLRKIFDKPDLLAFSVVTGTAANALSLACCSPLGEPFTAIRLRISASTRPTRGSSTPRAPGSGPAGKIDHDNLAAAAGRAGELVGLMNAVHHERLSHIGWTLRPLVASDHQLGRVREDHHCDGL